MDDKQDMRVAKEILRLRLSQMLVNEKYKASVFKIPLHIAMGHEAIAVAIDSIMKEHDLLACSHRNMHYNLARAKAFKPILNEYLLKKEGLAGAELGSMNLANPQKNLVYTSSILGNNLPVATGLALSQKIKHYPGIVFVATGDGAIEEGAFYESLVFAKANSLALIIIVENNDWSMHTKISERRMPIDLRGLATAIGAGYEKLEGNDTYSYIERLKKVREHALVDKTPLVLEVNLTTLGGWSVKNPDGSDRFVHPHSGPMPQMSLMEWPELEHSEDDPVFVLQKHFDLETLKKMSQEILKSLKEEINES